VIPFFADSCWPNHHVSIDFLKDKLSTESFVRVQETNKKNFTRRMKNGFLCLLGLTIWFGCAQLYIVPLLIFLYFGNFLLLCVLLGKVIEEINASFFLK
jgi:hypothetical protein